MFKHSDRAGLTLKSGPWLGKRDTCNLGACRGGLPLLRGSNHYSCRKNFHLEGNSCSPRERLPPPLLAARDNLGLNLHMTQLGMCWVWQGREEVTPWKSCKNSLACIFQKEWVTPGAGVWGFLTKMIGTKECLRKNLLTLGLSLRTHNSILWWGPRGSAKLTVRVALQG